MPRKKSEATLLKQFRAESRKASADVSLAGSYFADGALNSAARLLESAAAHMRKAAILKNEWTDLKAGEGR